MIWFISDLHGGGNMDGLERYLSFHKQNDLLIILGDVGLYLQDTEQNRAFNENFKAISCRLAFIDGNHENFDYLESLPVENWCGGNVHRVSDTVVHLMRGQIFTLEGKTFFTMGGCKSTQKWKDSGSWWPQEDPSEKEIDLAYQNLKKHHNKVDFILTHKYSTSDSAADTASLQGLFNYIEGQVIFRHWYSGHWHKTDLIDSHHTIVFQDPVKLQQAEL